jgi:lipopolysaccharide export system protein LptA
MFFVPRSLLDLSSPRIIGKLAAISISAIAFSSLPRVLVAQNPNEAGAITVRSDVQEANSETGVITARGNVQISYPARDIQATAAQAQYYSRERRLVMNGDVYVLQQGNSMRAESMTYLIDEGCFIATPKSDRQVESTYLVSEPIPSNN